MDQDIAGPASQPVNDLQMVVPAVALGVIDWIAIALVLIGGLNWGLVGVAQYDVVAAIFGGPDTVGARVVYGIVGLAALYGIYLVVRLATRRHA